LKNGGKQSIREHEGGVILNNLETTIQDLIKQGHTVEDIINAARSISATIALEKYKREVLPLKNSQ